MKWTSANSSDRKSVFYTSEDSNNGIAATKARQKSEGSSVSVTDNNGSGSSIFTFKMGGDDETMENSKSSSKSNSIERQQQNNGSDLKRYLKNFMLFSNLEIESEKRCRDVQLSKIVKALMLFEKKLRKEQEIIQQQLCEKDRVINRQMHTISNMKEKLKLGGENNCYEAITLEDAAEFCPMCRKKYYLRAFKSMATQTNLNGFTNNISDDYSSIQSIEYMSSSEEQEVLHSPNPFTTARRSKKYTSKKSYKEYLQSRPHSVNGGSINAIDVPGSDKNNNNIVRKESISKSSSGAAKFSLIMNDIHGIRQQQKQQTGDDTHSLKINRMHGISLTTLNVTNETLVMALKEKLVTINGERSESDRKEYNGNNYHDDAATQKYCDEGLEVKQKIATRDDWYISDIDENDTTLGIMKSPYGNGGVSNSVLECVNQILLQQSMDEYIDSQASETKPKEPSTRSNRRVHFSTKNSMVQIKSLPPPSDIHSSDDMLNSTYENQSTYSNEYELIGSSRTYVDMSDTRSVDSGFKPKLPPKPECLLKLQQIAKQRQFVQDQIFRKNSDYEIAESEEPDYASISEIQDNIKSVKIVTAEIHHNDENDDEEAVDNEYSEIKEVEEVPMTPTKVTNNNNTLNSSTSVAEDSFADVPKLPNVYSIIPGIESPTSPSKNNLLSPASSPNNNNNNKCIGHDNYITKSPMKKKLPIAFAKKLAEINVKKSPQSVAPTTPPPQTVPIKIIDEKLQQEFDWYNLDAEYTKSDIVITPQIENIDEMYQFDDENDTDVNGNDTVVKVEYNLEDFEYETVPTSSEGGSSSGSGIEIETNNNNFTTVIKINETLPSPSEMSPVKNSNSARKTTNTLLELAETPKVDYKKNKIRYENFLKETGLMSKPILTTRKKFCAGSFV